MQANKLALPQCHLHQMLRISGRSPMHPQRLPPTVHRAVSCRYHTFSQTQQFEFLKIMPQPVHKLPLWLQRKITTFQQERSCGQFLIIMMCLRPSTCLRIQRLSNAAVARAINGRRTFSNIKNIFRDPVRWVGAPMLSGIRKLGKTTMDRRGE